MKRGKVTRRRSRVKDGRNEAADDKEVWLEFYLNVKVRRDAQREEIEPQNGRGRLC